MIFRPTSPARLAAVQLQESRLALLEHQAAAEFNGAMARMLQERIGRLEAILNNQPTTIGKK